MKITRIDTLRLDEFPSLVHVLVHTDEGLVGLGETFFFADAAEAHVHTVADYLLGEDPGLIEKHARTVRGYVGTAGSGAEMRAASAIDIALWDLAGQASGQPLHRVLGGACRDSIRTYNTCAGYRYVRGESGQAVMNWGLNDEAEGPYEDLDAFLHRADELARDLLAQGITGMKIWPFDPYAEASLGHDISTADLDRALEPFRKIRAAVGPAMDVMAELHALWDVPAACRIAAALDELDLAWIEDPVRVSSPDALAEVQRATSAPIAVGETLTGPARVPRPDRPRRRADRDLRRRLGRRRHRGAQGGRARRGLRAAGRPARLHGPGRLHGGDAPLDAPAERDDPGERPRILERLVRRARDGAARDRERDGVRARPGPASARRSAPKSSSARTRTSARAS